MSTGANLDLLSSGIFTVPRAAELVQATSSMVRLWVNGRKNLQDPVIENELGTIDGKVVVSFTNLMELRFIAKFHNAGVRLNEIRKIMNEARKLLNHPHPMATGLVFRTDGKKILAQIGSENGVAIIYDLRTKNLEMPTVVMPSLKDDVIFDKNDEIVAWFPRKEIAPNIIVNPRLSFGRPILKNSHIPAETLADAVKAEGNVRVVAHLFEVPEKQVREAVRFCDDLRKAA